MPSPAEPTKPPRFRQRTPELDILPQAFNGFIYISSGDYRIQYMNDNTQERTGYDDSGEYCYKVLYGLERICPWCDNDQVFREQKTPAIK